MAVYGERIDMWTRVLPLAATPEPECSEPRLLAAARAGSVPAFERLYRRHGPTVYGLCLRLAGQRELAEECTQDCFLAAWRALPGFEQRSGFATWLHRIAVNAVLARHRLEARQSLATVDLDSVEPATVADGSTDPIGTLDVEQAIMRLPLGARCVLVLVGIYGYSHTEAAALLGIAAGTCKAQLFRARRLLAARLGLDAEAP